MRMSTKWSFLVSAWVLAASCGGNSSGSTPTTPTPVTTTFQGTIAGANNQTGTLTVTVQAQVAAVSTRFFRWPFVATLHAQSSVSATGSFRPAGGATTQLTGTYGTTTRAISLSGGGYTFTGAAAGATIGGSYTGPGGAAGAFSSRSTAGGTVTVYCGNVFGAPPDTGVVTGVFNLAVSDQSGAVSGAFIISADDADTVGILAGQVTGTAVSLTGTATAGKSVGATVSVTGTIQGGAFSGSSNTGNPASGSTSRCQ